MTPEEKAEALRRDTQERHGRLGWPGNVYLADTIRAAVEEEREACAQIVDERCKKVLLRQTGAQAGFNADVDMHIRMTAVLLPEVSESIRKRGQQ